MTTIADHNTRLIEVSLAHYESIGKSIFACVTESGATLETGDAETMRKAVSQHGEQRLYIYCQH